jgi:hypothetical protein
MNRDLEKRAEEILSEHENDNYDNKSEIKSKDKDNLSQGTMGAALDKSHTDENGEIINLDLEGQLPQKLLYSLMNTKKE